jgi:teichuronic acid biosynthesis glycosyltransferase TuaC
MTILTIQLSQDFPDNFYKYRGIFVKQAIDSIAAAGVNVEMVSPRAFVLPFNWFPNHGFSQVPRRAEEKEGRYSIHHPRYLYPVPKRFLYRFAGSSYASFVGNYIHKNLEKPDLLHSHFAYPDGFGMLELVDKWKIPLVVHLRGAFRIATGEPTFRTVKDKLMKVLDRADLIFTVSHSVKQEYQELGVPGEKMVVMPNGVNSERFYPIPQEDARFLLPGKLRDYHGKLVLFVGYLRKRKGVDLLVEAMPEVLKEHPDTHLIIIGEGQLRKRLEERGRELDMADRLSFLSNIPHEKMLNFINAADLTVLPTFAEGRPNIVLESMLCGRPVVATAVSGIPELVRDGVEGILIKPGESAPISRALCSLLGDETRMKQMGEAGRARIEALGLNWEEYGSKVKKQYQKLVL